MNDLTKILVAIIVFLVSLAGSFILGYTYRNEKVIERQIPPTIIRDTTYNVIERGVIKVQYLPGEVEYIDTSKHIMTSPFIARADTIIRQDTIAVQYSYPQNSFAFMLSMKPDTVVYIEIKTLDTKIIENKIPAWQLILSHTGAGLLGGVLGYGIGRIR
jgi:hypothetical protein